MTDWNKNPVPSITLSTLLVSCIDCKGCVENGKTIINDGPMVHLSPETRAQFCQRFGLTIGNNLVMTKDCTELDSCRHELVAIECARPDANCLLKFHHFLLIGTKDKSARLRELLTEVNNNRSSLPDFYRLTIPCSIPIRISSNAESSNARGILKCGDRIRAVPIMV